MDIRRKLITLGLAGVVTLGGGSALASHNGGENPEFSPCRETHVSDEHNPDGEVRLGYEDTADAGDARQELPTVYAKADEDDQSAYAGMCGGAKYKNENQHLEVGGSAQNGPDVYFEGKQPNDDPERVDVRSNLTGSE